jgi:methylglutaconyl-CoA hydratase
MGKIALERQGPVGLVTLDNPERHNALDDGVIAELTEAFRAMSNDGGVRLVVLSATGRSFCSGADIAWMKRMAGYSHQDNLRDAEALGEMLRTLDNCPKPVIARVQGAAFGGGVGLIACCDMAVGLLPATFALTEVKFGIVPATISPYVVAAIGARAARRYFLSAEKFDSAEAYRLGLLSDLAPDENELDEKIGAMVDALLECGPLAQGEAKDLIRAVSSRQVDAAMIADTAQRIARLRASDEGREGLGAFLDKRKPRWVPEGP